MWLKIHISFKIVLKFVGVCIYSHLILIHSLLMDLSNKCIVFFILIYIDIVFLVMHFSIEFFLLLSTVANFLRDL